MNIGLTGGIATGKSTVSALLVSRGALLVDADLIAREVVLPGSPVLQTIADRFGQGVLREDGSLDRKKLGKIVFSDPSARKDLNSIIHPPIRTEMKGRMNRFEEEHPDRLVVVDVPLLYESDLSYMFQEVMLVYVPREVQIERLMKRDGLDLRQAEDRIHAQMPIEDKRKRADIVIDNSGSLEQTERQIEGFWQGKGLK
jgi:dephospho-CoA kinase